MPKIVRAEFLHYRNPTKNSDKVFNIFLIENGVESFDCISEYGRRGNSPIRVVICANKLRTLAERDFARKLNAKRNHRQTPYDDNPDGSRDSQLAREFEEAPVLVRHNGIESPMKDTRQEVVERKPAGIINREQFDSLEI